MVLLDRGLNLNSKKMSDLAAVCTVLKNFVKVMGKHLCWSLFFNKAASSVAQDLGYLQGPGSTFSGMSSKAT